jgi:hypothetical protein
LVHMMLCVIVCSIFMRPTLSSLTTNSLLSLSFSSIPRSPLVSPYYSRHSLPLFLLLPLPLSYPVFDLVYPSLLDLFARSVYAPQWSLIISKQISRLAIASLSERSAPPIGTAPASTVGYLDQVVEYQCQCFFRTVARMKVLSAMPREEVEPIVQVRLY